MKKIIALTGILSMLALSSCSTGGADRTAAKDETEQHAEAVMPVSTDGKVITLTDLFEAYNLGKSIPAVVILPPGRNARIYIGTSDLLPAERFDSIISGFLN